MIDGKTSEAFSGISLPPSAETQAQNGLQIRLINQLAYAVPKNWPMSK